MHSNMNSGFIHRKAINRFSYRSDIHIILQKQHEKIIKDQQDIQLINQQATLKRLSKQLFHILDISKSRKVCIDPRKIAEIMAKKYSQINKFDFLVLYDLLTETIFKQSEIQKDVTCTLCQILQIRQFKENETILEIGNQAEYYFIVLKGKVNVKDEEGTVVKTIKEMEFVYQQEIVYNKQEQKYYCQYEVKAEEDVVLVVINISRFMKIQNERDQNMYLKRISFIESVPIFQNVRNHLIKNITYYFDSQQYTKDQFVYKEGDLQKNYIYIVWEGEFRISKKTRIGKNKNMTIVEKNGTIIDISPNKHSSLSQNLEKNFEFRKVSRMQILGLEEIIEHNEYEQEKQGVVKNNKKIEQESQELQEFKRKYSVQCMSQVGLVLRIEKNLFIDYYYNADGNAQQRVKEYLQQQKQIDQQKQNKLRGFVDENSQFIVFDRQRNISNYRDVEKKQGSQQSNQIVSRSNNFITGMSMTNFRTKETVINTVNNTVNNTIMNSVNSTVNNSINRTPCNKQKDHILISEGQNSIQVKQMTNRSPNNQGRPRSPGIKTQIEFNKTQITQRESQRNRKQTTSSGIRQSNSMKTFKTQEINSKDNCIKSDALKFPMMQDFKNITDENKVLSVEQLKQLNNLKKIQLEQNYDLRLIYRAKMLEEKKKKLSLDIQQDNKFKGNLKNNERSQMFINFFQNDFVDTNLLKNQVSTIKRQNMQMRLKSFGLQTQMSGQLSQKAQMTMKQMRETMFKTNPERNGAKINSRPNNNVKSSSNFRSSSNAKMNKQNLKKKAAKDYYSLFNTQIDDYKVL